MNKNISRITYNLLNLPKEIMFMDGSYIHYTYDAAGTLLRKGYYVGEELTEIPGDDEEELTGFRLPDTHLMSVGDEEEEKELVEEEEEIPYTDVIDYCGNCIYENGTLKMILIEDGYVTFDSNSQPVYHFYLQDHLGNNRVVANASGQVEQVNHYYPYGGLMAESTGGDVQRYKYNGKELDRMLGLDWYDYGARHYDGALTMWGTMDPLCEKYYGISPYVYCGDDPINAFDPDGKTIYIPKEHQSIILAMINACSKTQYKVNEKGIVCIDNASISNENGSAHYSERIDGIISSKRMLTIMVSEKYTATNGKFSQTFDVEKDCGGGLTDTTNKSNVKTVVSGKDHLVHDTEGNIIKKSVAEILIHEIVGHAAPVLVGTETGNAIKNENIIRKELGLSEREIDDMHYE